MSKVIKIKGYKITIEKDYIWGNKFEVGDLVLAKKSMCSNKGEIGIIMETNDYREDKLFNPKGRGWYYFVKYENGACLEKKNFLKRVKKFRDLIK